MPEIGHGSYGKVYVGKTDKGEQCAVKVEQADERTPQLAYEARVLRVLQGCRGVPRMYGYWVSEPPKANKHLAMELLGDTLEVRLRQHRMPMTVVMGSIAPTYIRILKDIHDRGFLHRDLKPQNMMTGPAADPTSLYLIDYGLSKRYTYPEGGHIEFRDGKRLTGNLRYAAVNVHLGQESSRRDDMEALGYVLVYFAKDGMLPWMSTDKGQSPYVINERVKNAKMEMRIDTLCEGLPAAFAHYLRHVRSLKFDQKPDYEFLASLFEVGLHDVMSMVGSDVSRSSRNGVESQMLSNTTLS